MIDGQIKLFVNIKSGCQTLKTVLITSRIAGLYVNVIKMLYLQAEKF
jgi:hypothetical protein